MVIPDKTPTFFTGFANLVGFRVDGERRLNRRTWRTKTSSFKEGRCLKKKNFSANMVNCWIRSKQCFIQNIDGIHSQDLWWCCKIRVQIRCPISPTYFISTMKKQNKPIKQTNSGTLVPFLRLLMALAQLMQMKGFLTNLLTKLTFFSFPHIFWKLIKQKNIAWYWGCLHP